LLGINIDYLNFGSGDFIAEKQFPRFTIKPKIVPAMAPDPTGGPRRRLSTGKAQATHLRNQIATNAKAWVDAASLDGNWYHSRGITPTVMFTPFEENGNQRHGNFLDVSYRSILKRPDWRTRLEKPHPSPQSLPMSMRGEARELDSSNSSDALVMNVFCHPETVASDALAHLFRLDQMLEPTFGFRAQIPKRLDSHERTEVDMLIDGPPPVLIEGKLTEESFTEKCPYVVESYRDLHRAFNVDKLPFRQGCYQEYQLIRNILAAYDRQARFVVVVDARRPDLQERFEGIRKCIRIRRLRDDCELVTWQAIAACVTSDLAHFLELKYGIIDER
jgi:hypothetical protein